MAKKNENYWVEELGRVTMPGYPLIILVYTWRDAEDPEDPAATMVNRFATFQPEQQPPEGVGALDPWCKENYEEKGRYSYRWDGLPHALADDVLEKVKEPDDDALDFRRESERAMERYRRYDYAKGEYVGEGESTAFESFLEAVEKYGEDESDDKSYAIIEAYLAEQTRRTEIHAKNI